ncbi:MAG: DNA-processing protein DprA [Vagococcus sp.]
MMDEQHFIFRLKHLKGIGNIGLLKILQHYLDTDKRTMNCKEMMHVGHVKETYKETFCTSYERAQAITEQDFILFLETTSFLTILDEAYPTRLTEIYNPPIALFYRGNIDWLKGDHLSIIGSRKATKNGQGMIEILTPPLIKKKIGIVSGLALGNDTYAHQATIRNGGKTIGIIGSGLDIAYPKQNERLQRYMEEHHLVLSEYTMGTRPFSYNFPARNRIIAGISRGTVVVEAKQKSGTFITAQLALEEGRDVFAVPSNPMRDNSIGCLKLIQDGAKCIWKASDILEEW